MLDTIETIPEWIKSHIKPVKVLVYPDKGCKLCNNGIHRIIRPGKTTRLAVCPRALIEVVEDVN